MLDRLMTLDIKRRGAVGVLYEAAHRQAGQSLTMQAASALQERVAKGSTVVLCTGFPVRPWVSPDIGETDGPPGVAALARAICTGLEGTVLVTAPAAMRPQVSAALQASGVLVLDEGAVSRATQGARPTCAAAIIDFPTNATEAAIVAERLIRVHRPAVVAAIEHPGANRSGVYHSSTGVDISVGAAKVEALFDRAAANGILTMSFIDMPNEIGVAGISEGAQAASPFALECGCPCHGGTAGATKVDVLVVGTTANWAAYGTVAALCVLRGDLSLAVTREHDRRAIEASQQAGALEGVSGSVWPAAGVDGVPSTVSGHIVDLLWHVAQDALTDGIRGPF
ncbi:MAG: DUF4392 domain-containing protein [Rhizobiales bacterium]|nr:DUF4392 domain-containing protein [Hyphomicrobiales bacterium]